MKAEDVDSALVQAGAILRASMEQQVDVDHAFDRLRDSIRARTTPAAAVSEMARSGGRAGEELTHPVAQHAGDPVPVATGRGREDAVIRMLYDEHAGPLLMFVLRLTDGDRQRAEDVVRQALMRAWRDAHRLGFPSRSLRPWLMAVAGRIATGDHQPVDGRPTTIGDPDLDGTDRWVADALREMRPSDREILIETYFRGRTVAEAAAKLHLPLGTAKARTYRAMRALRAALEQGHR